MTVLPSSLTPSVLRGHVLDVLRTLPSDSIQCVVTSPPYWGLRDYSRCGCATTRQISDEAHLMDGANRQPGGGNCSVDDPRTIRAPDPSCEWCGGTGTIRDYDRVWGGDPSHAHVFETPTPPRRSRSEADATNEVEQASVGGRNYEARGGSSCACGAWFGSLGLEATPEAYVAHLADVFEEVRRVLRPDGTCWLNLGDSYFTDSPVRTSSAGAFSKEWDPTQTASRGGKRRSAAAAGDLKNKDLVGIPWRVAFELQRRGWWLRSDIIWSKPNPMPESVTDRTTRSHEYIFLLTKSSSYYYDQDAVRSEFSPLSVERAKNHFPVAGDGGTVKSKWGDGDQRSRPLLGSVARATGGYSPSTLKELSQGYDGRATKAYHGTGAQDPSETKRRIIEGAKKRLRNGFTDGICDGCGRPEAQHVVSAKSAMTKFGADAERVGVAIPCNRGGANLKSVWTIATHPFKEAHFATFPPEIPERVIRLGTSEKGACAECGAPYERNVHRDVGDERSSKPDPERLATTGGHSRSRSPSDFFDQALSTTRTTVGWLPTCSHPDAPLLPSLVLDPFMGSGTTLEVARRLGRRSIGIDLNPEYVAMAARRSRANVPDIESFGSAPVPQEAK